MKTKKSKAPRSSVPIRRPQGYDGAGHIDPAHAQHLLALAREGRASDPDAAFIDATVSDDDLAEELAEAAVTSMTSAEDALGDHLEAEVEEERGGPFVETSGDTEFAEGTDESNTADATREPFPTT